MVIVSHAERISLAEISPQSLAGKQKPVCKNGNRASGLCVFLYTMILPSQMLHEDLIALSSVTVSTLAHAMMIQLCIFCKCYILFVYVQSICLTDVSAHSLHCLFFSESFDQISKCRYVVNVLLMNYVFQVHFWFFIMKKLFFIKDDSDYINFCFNPLQRNCNCFLFFLLRTVKYLFPPNLC